MQGRGPLLALAVGCAVAALSGCAEDDTGTQVDSVLEAGSPLPEGGLADAALPGTLPDASDAAAIRDAQPAVDATTLPPRMDAGGTPDAAAPRDAATGMDATSSADASTGPDPEPGRLAGITAAHNAVRAKVQSATPLPPLTWSTEIAAVAQAYAEKLAAGCSTTLVHSTPQERRGWGENLAMMSGFGTTPAGSAQQAVALWESEIKCYTFGPFQAGTGATCTSQCEMYGGCGHYTQVVWRKTARVGCGVGECMSGQSKRAFWVCNYDPPGNYLGMTPY